MLWTFARAHRQYPDAGHLALAQRARDFLLDQMWDREHGGLYWTVDHTGVPLQTRKQIYVQAFRIYALSEYAHATGDAAA